MIAVADTSGIIASIDRSCPEHTQARHVMDTAGLIVIALPVLAELDHIVGGRWGKEAAGTVVDQLLAKARAGRYAVAECGVDALTGARSAQKRYRDLQLDLTDAVLTVVAKEYATNAVLTLDRKDFRTMRPLSGHTAFRLLPDDL
ncbi:PIN domain-containing protein [Streptomyces pathocidini]|uniref:PIN domain-containing protein n=1 Tax=Streptomyces pathocidini TaxID=1650571 RepID=UPI00340E11C2